MSHEAIRPLLDDYLDDELPPAARLRVEEHLEGCEACAAELASLTTLTHEARGLPREILPTRDLWQGIEARLQARRPGVLRLPLRPAPVARPWMMAAAALLLVALSSGVTMMVVRQQAPTPSGASQAAVPPRAPEGTALAAFAPAEAEFVRTAEELHRALEAGGAILDPETLAVIEASLAVIDQAIAEARAALEADPQNATLALMLSGVYRQKVEVLQGALHHEARS